MMPRRSPWCTSKLTSLTAVSPPNRLVTCSRVSMASRVGPCRATCAKPLHDAGHALGHEAHHDDEDGAVDHEVERGEPAVAGLDEVGRGGAQERLQRRD